MDERPQDGMTLIVKTVTRITLGLIVLYGLYIVLHGHLSPGGGFAGGVILALSFIHLELAYGRRVTSRKMSESLAATIESGGAVLFLALALLGLAGGAFFLNLLPRGEPFHLVSGGFIPLCNVAIMAKVSGGLFAIFLALVLLRPEEEGPS
jgi:multicomponent Na+:H+ antiporter subunit B